jgi:hypothetical protein
MKRGSTVPEDFRHTHRVLINMMVGDRLPEISFVLNQNGDWCRNSDEGKRRRSKVLT